LQPVHTPAFAPQDSVGPLVVENTGARTHPLRFTWADRTDIAEAVAMFSAALKQIRQRFEPSMRMVWRALGLARRKVDRAHMIEKDEGADGLQTRGGNGAADLKAFALHHVRSGDKVLDLTSRREKV
jgi:hypothetical protein